VYPDDVKFCAKDGAKLLVTSTASPTPATPPLGVPPVGATPPSAPAVPRSPTPPFAGPRTVDFSKLTGQLQAGQRLRIETPGGGGYGDPHE